MTTTTTAPAQAGDYIRIRTSYPAGSPAQRQLVLAADATGLPLDGADEVAIVLCTSIEWRPAPDHGSGYWYVGWRNEQPALGAPRRVYNGTSGPRHVVGWDPRLGSFGAFRHYADPSDQRTHTRLDGVVPRDWARHSRQGCRPDALCGNCAADALEAGPECHCRRCR